jgi:NADH-quinone oxidoreductase subunit B
MAAMMAVLVRWGDARDEPADQPADHRPPGGHVTDLPDPTVGPPVARGSRPLPLRLDLRHEGREATVWVLDVGLACCSVELMAAAADRHGARSAGGLVLDPAAVPDVLVVAGTCTDAMAPALRRAYDALPEGTRVVSFGACACSGGPYWDSYSVTKGIDQLVPVDVYVPGCPPRPEALLDAVLSVAEATS